MSAMGDGGPAFEHEDFVRRATGARVVRSEALPAGLGTRRFFRLRLDGPPGSLIARVEAPEDPAGRPPGSAPEPPLEPLRSWLEASGVPVPRSFGCDPVRGVDLLEDLGDRDLAQAVRESSAASRHQLYAEITACVARLQGLGDAPTGLPAFRRRLDPLTLAYKGELFARWSLPEGTRRRQARQIAAAFEALAEHLADAPLRLAHRDLQSHNVMVPEGPAGPRWVLIDLQGAWLAPPEYDLVCLLRDSYVELPAEEVEAHLARVRHELPDAPAPEVFRLRFDLLSLARKTKDHARLRYVAATRGDARGLACLPATVRALRSAAAGVRGLDPRIDALADAVEGLPLVEARGGGGARGDSSCGG